MILFDICLHWLLPLLLLFGLSSFFSSVFDFSFYFHFVVPLPLPSLLLLDAFCLVPSAHNYMMMACLCSAQWKKTCEWRRARSQHRTHQTHARCTYKNVKDDGRRRRRRRQLDRPKIFSRRALSNEKYAKWKYEVEANMRSPPLTHTHTHAHEAIKTV